VDVEEQVSLSDLFDRVYILDVNGTKYATKMSMSAEVYMDFSALHVWRRKNSLG